MDEHESTRRGSSKAQAKAQNQAELKRIIQEYRKLLSRIEDAVPLINLAITTSGASLSTTLPATVSPSRLLQASTFLSQGDIQYSRSPAQCVQIGPTFTLSLYMLFSGHLRPQSEDELRESTWKEVMHKAKVKLLRVPIDRLEKLPEDDPLSEALPEDGNPVSRMEGESKGDEFAYQLLLIEDHDDDRVHTYEEDEVPAGPYNEVELAGIREVVPVHQISKIFYADTGKVLNIGCDSEVINPVLLLKRDTRAPVPRTIASRAANICSARAEAPVQDPGFRDREENGRSQSLIDAQLGRENIECEPTEPKAWQFPHNLDKEWMALEVYTESEQSDTESEAERSTLSPGADQSSRAPSLDPELTSALANLKVNSSPAPTSASPPILQPQTSITSSPGFPPIRSSLSLLDMILRLLVLQQVEQTSHLAIPDEKLNFFLVDAATTGGEDEQRRRRLREDARKRVGFDPYDESPIKLKGEYSRARPNSSRTESEYGQNENDYPYGGSQVTDPSYAHHRNSPYDEGYETNRLYSPTYLPKTPYSREISPETPHLLLKDHSQSPSTRFSTPDRANSLPSLPSSSPLQDAALNRINFLPPIPSSSLSLPSSPIKIYDEMHTGLRTGEILGQQPRKGLKGSGRTGTPLKQSYAISRGPVSSSLPATPDSTHTHSKSSNSSPRTIMNDLKEGEGD